MVFHVSFFFFSEKKCFFNLFFLVFLRGFIISCRVLGSMIVVSCLCCGACTVSYPQPPSRKEHGCTMGVDRDPPVWCSHPSKIMGTSERQLLRACLRFACGCAHVVTRFCGVVLSDFRTPPRAMPLALSFDLGTAPPRSTALCLSSWQTHSPSTCARDPGHLWFWWSDG